MPPKNQASSAPRPQHSRKPSAANAAAGAEKAKRTKDTKDKDKSKDMPPPPPKPMAILEPEMKALEDCLKVRTVCFELVFNWAHLAFLGFKNVVVSTAQFFKFHSDSKKLYVPASL